MIRGILGAVSGPPGTPGQPEPLVFQTPANERTSGVSDCSEKSYTIVASAVAVGRIEFSDELLLGGAARVDK